MKKNYAFKAGIITFLLAAGISFSVSAQAFRRGSLMVSISEGTTWSNYSTTDASGGKPQTVHSRCIKGVRDPFFIEYGISNRWSLGMSSGADIYKIDASSYYGLRTSDNQVKATTSEFTFDGCYHFFVGQRLDLSAFGSLGFYSVSIKGSDNDNSYSYTAKGNTLRVGTRIRYYFWKRFGAFGMVSSYVANCSTKDVRGNTMGNNYGTSLNGFAIEGGLCYRILK